MTKADFEQKLANLVTKVDFEQKLANLVTKVDFEQKLASLVTKADLEQKLANVATKVDLEIWGERLMAELARHTKAIQEALSVQISVVDEKYTDLPGRVTRLETTVFGPKRR